LPSKTHFAQSGRSVRVVALLKQTNVKFEKFTIFKSKQEQISHDETRRQNVQELGVTLWHWLQKNFHKIIIVFSAQHLSSIEFMISLDFPWIALKAKINIVNKTKCATLNKFLLQKLNSIKTFGKHIHRHLVLSADLPW